jgi:hypothetical protein
MKIQFTLNSAEFADAVVRRAEPSILKLNRILTLVVAPMLGLLLAVHGPIVCCLLPPLDYYFTETGQHSSTKSKILYTTILFVWRAAIHIGVLMLLSRSVGPGLRRWMHDKAVNKANRNNKTGERSVEIQASGLQIQFPYEIWTMDWRNVVKVEELDGFVYLTFVGDRWIAVPTRAFSDGEQIAQFVDAISRKIFNIL